MATITQRVWTRSRNVLVTAGPFWEEQKTNLKVRLAKWFDFLDRRSGYPTSSTMRCALLIRYPHLPYFIISVFIPNFFPTAYLRLRGAPT